MTVRKDPITFPPLPESSLTLKKVKLILILIQDPNQDISIQNIYCKDTGESFGAI